MAEQQCFRRKNFRIYDPCDTLFSGGFLNDFLWQTETVVKADRVIPKQTVQGKIKKAAGNKPEGNVDKS